MEQSLGRGSSVRFGIWAKAVSFALLGSVGCGGRTDQAAACSPLTGCGGDLVGTWDVTSMCVRVLDGAVVPSARPQCEPVSRHALDIAVIVPTDMTATFTKDTYFRSGTATLDTSYVFTDACLAADGYDVASAATCDQVGLGIQSGSNFSGFNFAPTVVNCRLDSASCVCQVSGDVTVSDSGSYRVQDSQIFFDGQATGGTYCSRNDRALISTDSTSTNNRMGLKRR